MPYVSGDSNSQRFLTDQMLCLLCPLRGHLYLEVYYEEQSTYVERGSSSHGNKCFDLDMMN